MHANRLTRLLATILVFTVTSLGTVFAGAQEDVERIMKRIKVKVDTGKTSEVELGSELVQLSDLQTKYKSQKADAALVLFARATIYADVINDREMALMLFDEVRHAYPNTMAAMEAEQKLQAMVKPAPQRPTPRGGNRNDSSSSNNNGR